MAEEKKLTAKQGAPKKWGFVDEAGNWVIKPQFDNAGDFKEGFAQIKMDGKYGFIDERGKIIVPAEFDRAINFGKDGIGAVEINGKWAFVNREGELVGDKYFDDLHPFYRGGASVQDGNNWYIIDVEGNKVSSETFEYIYDFNEEGVAIVYKNEKYGLINSKGEIIYEVKAQDIENIKLIDSYNLMAVEIEDKYGIMNLKGEMLYEPIYDDYWPIYEGKLLLERNGKWGFADKKGGWDMEPVFEDYHPQNFYGTHHNFGYARVGDKWGFMGYSGQEWLIEPQFDEVLETDFNDIFIVKEGNKAGLVNRRDGFILEPVEAQDAGIFYAHDDKYLFKLKVKNKWGIINDNRQWIIEPSIDELGRCSSQKDYTIFVKNGKKGFIKSTGDILIDSVYDEIYEFANNIARIKSGGKYGFIDINGNQIIPPIYDQAEDFSTNGETKVLKGIKVIRLNTKGEEI